MKYRFLLHKSFFGPVHELREVFLEESFILQMHLHMNYETTKNLPVRYRRWFLERLKKHFDTMNNMYNSKGSSNDANSSNIKNLEAYQQNLSKKF